VKITLYYFNRELILPWIDRPHDLSLFRWIFCDIFWGSLQWTPPLPCFVRGAVREVRVVDLPPPAGSYCPLSGARSSSWAVSVPSKSHLFKPLSVCVCNTALPSCTTLFNNATFLPWLLTHHRLNFTLLCYSYLWPLPPSSAVGLSNSTCWMKCLYSFCLWLSVIKSGSCAFQVAFGHAAFSAWSDWSLIFKIELWRPQWICMHGEYKARRQQLWNSLTPALYFLVLSFPWLTRRSDLWITRAASSGWICELFSEQPFTLAPSWVLRTPALIPPGSKLSAGEGGRAGSSGCSAYSAGSRFCP